MIVNGGDKLCQMAAITKSLEEGDDSLVGAALDASRFLTGKTPVAQAHIRAMWAQKRMPAEVARIKVLEAAAEHLNRGGTLLIGCERKCTDQVIVAQVKARATRPASQPQWRFSIEVMAGRRRASRRQAKTAGQSRPAISVA